MKKDNMLEELKICYIAQYGFDLVIGPMCGLDLATILRLEEIMNDALTNNKEFHNPTRK